MKEKVRAPNNRTVTLTAGERASFLASLATAPAAPIAALPVNSVFLADCENVIPCLPDGFVDLLFLDPPYNLSIKFGDTQFKEVGADDYETWFRRWFVQILRLLKPTATLYVCGDWRSGSAIQRVLEKHVTIRNRITWEREKGRGARTNWKSAHEDIWFATKSDDYTFNVDAVKLRRRVLAPYKVGGVPKDWDETQEGDFRLTHPSNLWSDLSVPFWSMPENTDHPAQKPEKLLAKLLLASTNPGDVVLDPFLGSGTSAVVAKKLGRHFVGIEAEEEYACLALKRLALATVNPEIQGYSGGVFWERNTGSQQVRREPENGGQTSLRTSRKARPTSSIREGRDRTV